MFLGLPDPDIPGLVERMEAAAATEDMVGSPLETFIVFFTQVNVVVRS
jgi:hypothetical protein